MKFYRGLLWIQAIYTFITSLWALLDIESFMVVSGLKTDIWLVKTVSVLLIAISMCYFSALYLKTDPRPIAILAICSSLGLAIIDFYYTSTGTIKWVYVLDGIAEVLFLAGWTYVFVNRKH